jgi:hypothetical protein
MRLEGYATLRTVKVQILQSYVRFKIANYLSPRMTPEGKGPSLFFLFSYPFRF